MGSLRFILALAVLLSHAGSTYVLIGGRLAVHLFYVISGFLISYILIEKKAYSKISNFYINRYLRLYPIYFVVAILTLLAITLGSFGVIEKYPYFEFTKNAPFSANLLLIFSNITLFFQDLVMFLSVVNNHLVFSADISKSEINMWQALLLPQAWTLSLELNFYLIAPFFLSKRKILISLFLLSLALRIYLYSIGLEKNEYWSNRFFPTELCFFLLGSLSHQIILPIYYKILSKKYLDKYAYLATYALILIVIIFWDIPIQQEVKTILLFCLFPMLLPLAFLFQSKRGWDRIIGELSYPLYICHILVIYIIEIIFYKLDIESKILKINAAVIFSICFSIILNIYINNPIELLRNRYKKIL